ncbi:helix-turn-helix transcriptional regulator [Micromonospora sp. NPDC050695]|uniref:helix-turn-helix domain-containing protein n=1 Tax=Micromonospora sp. NPDC050695 TaxID=3154938 RepID=UPI0033D06DA7
MAEPLPPQVSLRIFREFVGLTLQQVAEAVREQGVPITADGLNNVELGRKPGSEALMLAVARALNIKRLHIRQAADICEWVDAVRHTQGTKAKAA